MKRHPRQAKLAAKPIIDKYSSEESSDSEQEVDTGKFFKGIKKEVEKTPDELSESEFEGRGKKRKNMSASRQPASKKSKLISRLNRPASPVQPIPPVSDDEHEEDRPDDITLFEKVKKPLKPSVMPTGVRLGALPKTIQIQVLTAPANITLNLHDLLAPYAGQRVVEQDFDGDTLLGRSVEGSDAARSRQGKDKALESFAEMRANPEYACFLELEPQLRNRIYRAILVKDKPVKFNPSPDLCRTAALLRTCRQVNQEATGILYGENAFHLDRTEKSRGTLYTTWREIGYKDMRRFLETIGQDNLSKMRFLSISLADGIPLYTPELSTEERRYQNDPVLHHIFRLIGNSGAVFERLVVNFGGRGNLEYDHIPFIRAFITMKCRSLRKICRWNHDRINPGLFNKMQTYMQVPTPDDVDPDKARAPTMQHQLLESRIHLGCSGGCYGGRYFY